MGCSHDCSISWTATLSRSASPHARVSVEIADNGVGLGTSTRSSGLSNLRKRAEQQHNGTLALDTTDRGGTRLTWTAHCA